MNKNCVVIIPTLNPNIDIMSKFLNKLKSKFANIIVLNDGSDEKYDDFFKNLSKENITVLNHDVNQGKGRAIKTAINYTYKNYNDFEVIVTADSDGQHQVDDIIKCANVSLNNPNNLILGSRNFKETNVPFKSRYGNIITSNVFKILVGLKIQDTQTGLRAMHKNIASEFLNTNGERFEYETQVLIDCKNKDIPITEIEIETIYINDNSESHFNPLKDSFMIYKLFSKYLLTAISSFLIDISIFALLLSFDFSLTYNIFYCTVFARIISSVYNYLVNKHFVFKNFTKNSFIKYYLLVTCQMFISAFLVSKINIIFVVVSPVIIKFFVDLIIFITNFIIQREWVFKSKKKH